MLAEEMQCASSLFPDLGEALRAWSLARLHKHTHHWLLFILQLESADRQRQVILEYNADGTTKADGLNSKLTTLSKALSDKRHFLQCYKQVYPLKGHIC